MTRKKELFDIKQTYVRPNIDFQTSTSLWPADELIARRVKDWKKITKEDGETGSRAGSMRKDETVYSGTYSIFPAPLAEWIYLRYAGKKGNTIIDPFAGGPPRGVVASVMGYKYHGVDIRQEAVDENTELCDKLGLSASYHLGDARTLKIKKKEFDFCIACPPYHDLEVYSEQDDDMSGITDYADFDLAMEEVAQAIFKKLKDGAFACLIVGNFRNKKTSELIDFRGDTVTNMKYAGFKFWQDVVLSRSAGSAAVRAGTSWRGLKLVPRHEYLLVFRKE